MSRYIPKPLKLKILDDQNNKCNNKPGSKSKGLENYDCPLWKKSDGTFPETGFEIDHILEFSISKDSSRENLQALCLDCHKTKTNNFNFTKRKNISSNSELEIQKLVAEMKSYTENCKNLLKLATDSNQATTAENQQLQTKNKSLIKTKRVLITERDSLLSEKQELILDKNQLILERDNLINNNQELVSENKKLLLDNNLLNQECQYQLQEYTQLKSKSELLISKLIKINKSYVQIIETCDKSLI